MGLYDDELVPGDYIKNSDQTSNGEISKGYDKSKASSEKIGNIFELQEQIQQLETDLKEANGKLAKLEEAYNEKQRLIGTLYKQLANIKYLDRQEVEKIFDEELPDAWDYCEEKRYTVADERNIITALLALAIPNYDTLGRKEVEDIFVKYGLNFINNSCSAVDDILALAIKSKETFIVACASCGNKYDKEYIGEFKCPKCGSYAFMYPSSNPILSKVDREKIVEAVNKIKDCINEPDKIDIYLHEIIKEVRG